jgi:hypothetical protein
LEVTEMLWSAHAREILVREHARKNSQRQCPGNRNISSAPGSNMPILFLHLHRLPVQQVAVAHGAPLWWTA